MGKTIIKKMFVKNGKNYKKMLVEKWKKPKNGKKLVVIWFVKKWENFFKNV